MRHIHRAVIGLLVLFWGDVAWAQTTVRLHPKQQNLWIETAPQTGFALVRDTILQLAPSATQLLVRAHCNGIHLTDLHGVPATTLEISGKTDVDVAIPAWVRIESEPFGAKVTGWMGDSGIDLGETPVAWTNRAGIVRIGLQKNGFMPEEVPLPNDACVLIQHKLTPQPAGTTSIPWTKRFVAPKNGWISWASGAVALGAGVYSIRQKFEADRLYKDFIASGDPSLKPQIKAHDTRAGWGLAAMQTGLAVIVVRFVLR